MGPGAACLSQHHINIQLIAYVIVYLLLENNRVDAQMLQLLEEGGVKSVCASGYTFT